MYFNNIAYFLNQAESTEVTTIPVVKGELKDLNLSAVFREMRQASNLSGAEAVGCSKVALAQNAYVDDNYGAFLDEIRYLREQAIKRDCKFFEHSHYCCLLEYNDEGTDYNIGFNMEMRVLVDVETEKAVAVNVYFHRDRSTTINSGKRQVKLIDTAYNYQEESRLGLLASSAEMVEHFLIQTIACAEKSKFHHSIAAEQLYKHYFF